MASFVLSFFPPDVLDEIWDLIESVAEGFLTYFCITRVFDVTCQVSILLAQCFWKGRFFYVIHAHGGHLGHVPLTKYINYLSYG